MEILILFFIWIALLYIIRLKKEINGYRKYFSQHDSIYVPSYKEITVNNHWTIQLVKYIASQLREAKITNAKLLIPTFRKHISDIATVGVEKK